MRRQILHSPQLTGFGRGARGSGGSGAPMYALAPPSDGLIADWRFAEGSGTTAFDETGTFDIDLTVAPSPNVAWAPHGLTTTNGAVQTPSMTGVRTIVQLHRVPRDEVNKFLQAGPVADNQGPFGRSVQIGEKNWVGQGYGVFPVFARSDGQYAWSMATGGWRLYIREIATNTTGKVTFGSRGAATTNRYTEMKMAWAAVYDKVLSPSERETLYSFARGVATGRGIYIDAEDCPIQVDHLMLMGQSNADGRGYIASLSAGDQARTYAHTKIYLAGLGVGTTKSYSDLVLGSNHNRLAADRFGPEIPIANLREDTAGARDLYITKVAQGGTYLAPESDANVAAGTTFSTETAVGINPSFWTGVLANLYYGIADALDDGIGLDLRGLVWFQGEQDALQSSTADVWEVQMSAIIAQLDTHLGTSDYPVLLARIFETPPDDATSYATIRAAQVAVVAGLGARGTLIDTDSMSRGDYVHLNASGLVDFGINVVDAIW